MYDAKHLQAIVWTGPVESHKYELLDWLRVLIGIHVLFVGALYHPPKPLYQPSALLDHVEECVDRIEQEFCDARILLAGDFNCLDGDELVSRCALNSIVDQPTRGANRLDQIMSAISHMTVLKSLRRPLRATTRISSPPRVQHLSLIHI